MVGWVAPALICAASCTTGAGMGAVAFTKLSDLVEYTLNKQFGDYTNLKRTLSDIVIVSMPRNRDYYTIRQGILFALVTRIFIGVFSGLQAWGCHPFLVSSLVVGAMIGALACALNNMYLNDTGQYRGYWVEVPVTEYSTHGITNTEQIEKIQEIVTIYRRFGASQDSQLVNV